MTVAASPYTQAGAMNGKRRSHDALDRELAALDVRLRFDAGRIADELLRLSVAAHHGLADRDAGAELLADLDATLGQLRLVDAMLDASPSRPAAP